LRHLSRDKDSLQGSKLKAKVHKFDKMLTDFQNSFTVVFAKKFATKRTP